MATSVGEMYPQRVTSETEGNTWLASSGIPILYCAAADTVIPADEPHTIKQ